MDDIQLTTATVCVVITIFRVLARYRFALEERRKRNNERLRLSRHWHFRRRRQLILMVHIILTELKKQKRTSPRCIWMKQRCSGVFDNMMANFNDEEFKENFRVDRNTFDFLCETLSPHIKRLLTNMRWPISVQKRVAITLWRLATNCEYRTLGNLFGVARNTACNIVQDTCQAIVNAFEKDYLNFPVDDEVVDIVRGFENRWGFPQCVGAIDGTHIPIIAPQDHPVDYYNRKGFYSIVMQAVVDFRYRFIDVNVGWPGKVHDARILSNTSLYKKAERGTLLPSICRTIRGHDIPLLILGDPAYPLLPWLMKGFPERGTLSEDESRFNYRLSRARMVVENAFGRLKGRWRSLLKRNDTALLRLPLQVRACCILHNICESRKDLFRDNWLEEAAEYRQQRLHDANRPGINNHAGVACRNALVRYFAEGY